MIFFRDFHPFAFQIQRLMAECPAGGGEATEVSRAVARMTAGDFDSWQESWTWLADHVRDRADRADNPTEAYPELLDWVVEHLS